MNHCHLPLTFLRYAYVGLDIELSNVQGPKEGLKIQGASSNMVGIICSLVEIGLTNVAKSSPPASVGLYLIESCKKYVPACNGLIPTYNRK